MSFREVPNNIDFIAMEKEILAFWKENDSFEKLRKLRADSDKIWSFIDGPITANNPMGVHHAWGRTYKDLFCRYHAMLGKNLRWQNGFDCQGLWVEVNVEKELGFETKRDIEEHGLEQFIKLCKMRVLKYAAVQTEQSIRLGYWMDWNDTDELRRLHDLMEEDAGQQTKVTTPNGTIEGTVEQVVGQLGSPEWGGSYFTFSDENNYTIWSMLKKLFEDGKIYRGNDVVPWSGKQGTSYSQMEIIDGRKLVAHRSVFVRFPLKGRDNEFLLVWTTTPWTLTSNVAAGVNADLEYVKLQAADGAIYYFVNENLKFQRLDKQFKEKKQWVAGVPKLKTIHQVFKERGGYEVLGTLKGAELVGLEYEGPFDELPAQNEPGGYPFTDEAAAEKGVTSANSHRVIDGGRDSIGEAVVVAGEGTGIVHMAPGCGEIDHQIGKKLGLMMIAPLDEEAKYLPGFDWLTGLDATDPETTTKILDNLKEKGFLLHVEEYPHVYPHCWRSGEELVFRIVDEWYINMDWRDRIKKIVDDVQWYPGWGRDREMDWLGNMGDWMISKKRFWGLALPIWQFEDDSFWVVGSREELKELAVEGWDEFEGHTPHRPYVDKVKIKHPETGLIGTRIEDVGNPWLDAGIVPFSTIQYNTDREYWDKWFPADWVSESFPGQFRNWFYSLLAQSTVLTDRAPFKSLFGYSTLIAEDGREMHKSWGNAIWFDDAADKMGADTMRWLYAGSKPEKNVRFGYAIGDETRRQFIIPLWNVYSFFATYARIDGWTPTEGRVESTSGANAQLDKWIHERLDETTIEVRDALEVSDPEAATLALESMLDDLSNWYVRRSRRRFWRSEADADKKAAYGALYDALVTFSKLLAPFVPFISEKIYQNLVRGFDSNAPESVHHCLYPEADASKLDRDLLDRMRLVITVAGLGRAARSSVDMKIRQPLAIARVNVASEKAQRELQELGDVIIEELNVKKFEVVTELSALVSYKLLPNSRTLGPKFGKEFPKVRKALSALDPTAAAASIQAGKNLVVEVDGEKHEVDPSDVLLQTESKGSDAVASAGGVTVAVDIELTPALLQEGFARDLVRTINNMRKDAGFEISDQIHIKYEAAGDAGDAVTNFADYIKQETLALSLEPGDGNGDDFKQQLKVGENEVAVSIQKR